MIEIYDYEGSSCGTKVRWALAELSLEHRRRRLDMMQFDHKTADYIAVHPEGLVPAAVLDGDHDEGRHVEGVDEVVNDPEQCRC